MKKLAIVGGGICGLHAAYQASKNNVDSVLFEESSLAGGRLEYCVSATSPRFQPQLYNLIKELGLEVLSVPLSPKLLGIFAGDKVMPYSMFPEMIKSMPPDQQQVINGIIGEAMQSNFSVENPSENLIKLRTQSFGEYLKNCSGQVVKMFMEPMMVFTFLEKINMADFSADYGLFNIRFGMEMGGEQTYTFEEGVRILADILQKKAIDKGVDFMLSSRVTKVEKASNSFKIHYQKLNEEKDLEAENVLFAIPLPLIKNIMPEVDLGTGVSYGKTKCYFTEGELRGEEKIIMGMPGNKANLRFLFAGPYNFHYVYPFENDKPVAMDLFYKNCKITGEEIIENTFPIIAPNTKPLEVKTNIEGVFAGGDHYFYPLIETSLVTAQKAIEMVLSQK